MDEQKSEPIFLPDSFLNEILENASKTSKRIEGLTNNFISKEQEIRRHLSDQGLLNELEKNQLDLETYRTIGIDGGRAIEHLLLYDLGMVGVVASGGLDAQTELNSIRYKSWFDILPHYGANTMNHITQAIMHLYEFQLVTELKSDFTFMDGRFITPLIGFSAIASIKKLDILEKIVPLFSNVDLTKLLSSVFSNKKIIAVQKYDSSRNFSLQFLQKFKISIDDRALFSLILKEGEYTTPIPLQTFPDTVRYLSSAHLTLKGRVFEYSTDFEDLNSLLSALPEEIYALYYRPRPWSPALRLEISKEIARDSKILFQLLDCLRSEMLTTEMKEPFPLYFADKMAKSVGLGLKALKEASRSILTKDKQDDASMFFESYRSD